MAPSHYLDQCWNVFNWNLGTNFSQILIGNQTSSFQENALENIVWKMAAIVSWLNQCVKGVVGYGHTWLATDADNVVQYLKWLQKVSVKYTNDFSSYINKIDTFIFWFPSKSLWHLSFGCSTSASKMHCRQESSLNFAHWIYRLFHRDGIVFTWITGQYIYQMCANRCILATLPH